MYVKIKRLNNRHAEEAFEIILSNFSISEAFALLRSQIVGLHKLNKKIEIYHGNQYFNILIKKLLFYLFFCNSSISFSTETASASIFYQDEIYL